MADYRARQSMIETEVAITATATEIAIATGMNGREFMLVSNTGTVTAFIGGSAVTSTTGYPLRPNASQDFGLCSRNFNFFAICVSGSATTMGVYET